MRKIERGSSLVIILIVLMALVGGVMWFGIANDNTDEQSVDSSQFASKNDAQRSAQEKSVAESENIQLQHKRERLVGKMIFIPNGSFLMGGTNGSSYEEPVHFVRLKGFELGAHEVTQKQWKEVTGDNPSYNKGCDDCPVEKVSWNDIQGFLKKLNKQTERNYRLPSEAEWEYACRNKGLEQQYCGGSNKSKLGWYKENSDRRTHPVGLKKSNGLGLYDMTGNVWEWVQDCWNESYIDAPSNEAAWLKGNCEGHVLRGGSWDDNPYDVRTTYRNWSDADKRYFTFGFRLARD